MGLQKPNRQEIAQKALAPVESTDLDQITEPSAEAKKVGRPKKERKPRSAAQLANDQRQRERFKKEHAARKASPKTPAPSPEPVEEEIHVEEKQEEEPVEESVEEEPVKEPVEEEPAESEEEEEVEEETVYIKRKPRVKRKRTYVVESSSSDDDDYMDESRYRRPAPRSRRVPEPRFSPQDDPFTLTFA